MKKIIPIQFNSPKILLGKLTTKCVFIFLIFFMGFLFSSRSQTNPKNINNFTDKSGLRQGNWILFWKDMDTLHRCGSDHECSADKLASNFLNSGYKLETKFMECTYKNGVIEGLVIHYFPSGKIKSKKFFTNGKTDGMYQSFYESGQLKETGVIKNHTQAGISSMYYENGNLKARVTFNENGKINGSYNNYYENGMIQSVMYYYVGKRSGYGLSFDTTGKLTNKYYYIDGAKVNDSLEKKNELDVIL